MSKVTELEQAIRAQPAELRRIAEWTPRPSALEPFSADRVWLIGTGTSLHAAELGAQMLVRAGIDARAESSLALSRRSGLRRSDGFVVITHTGETAYARAARQRISELGAKLIALTADGVGWSEAIGTGERERSHTYTRSYTSALAHLSLIAGELGAEGLTGEAVIEAADACDAALADSGLGAVPAPARLLVLTGVGPGAVTAREAALKLREAARLAAEGMDAEHLLHGSAVPLGPADAIVVLDRERDDDGLLALLGSAAAAEGVPVAYLAQPSPADELMAQIPLTLRLQLLALQRAEAAGHDPDLVITGSWDGDALWSAGAPGP